MARTVVRARPRRLTPGGASSARNPAGLAGTVYSGTADNTGTVATAPTIEIAGPSPASFFLRNATTGKTLHVAYTVASGQTLVIDFGARTTKVAGAAVAAIVGAQQWWSLEPGNNTIQSSASNVTVKFNPAFI